LAGFSWPEPWKNMNDVVYRLIDGGENWQDNHPLGVIVCGQGSEVTV
jgi:hypothetical protein